jgi:hypothetical protein
MANIIVRGFKFDSNEDEANAIHNVALAVGVFGRTEELPDTIAGQPVIAWEIVNDTILASASIATGVAEVEDYWEGASSSAPNQITFHNIITRQYVCTLDEAPEVDETDGRAFLEYLWSRLTVHLGKTE